MDNNSTADVYLNVVDDVTHKMREAFIDYYGDDSALVQIQALWELKMMQSGVIPGCIPYETIEGYETPTEEMLFPPTPVRSPSPAENMQLQYFPAGQGENGTKLDTTADVKPSKKASFMQQPSRPWLNQEPLGVGVNPAHKEATAEGRQISEPQFPVKNFPTIPSSKRKREEECSLYQKVSSIDVHAEICPEVVKLQKRENADASIAKQAALIIPQHDGHNDLFIKVDRTEDCNTPSYYVVEDDEPPLNEDDDEDETDAVSQRDVESSITDLVLAQFEKVWRSKGSKRWKCLLKAGMSHLNDKDILFRQANGEFDFF